MKIHKFLNIIKKKSIKRIFSFATALVLLTNSVPLPGPIKKFHFDLFSSNISASASDAFDFSNGNISLNSLNASQFTDYCFFYSKDEDFAKTHQNDIIGLTEYHDTGVDFIGLGHVKAPFRGTLMFSGTGTNMLDAPCAIFTHVYDSVRMIQFDENGSDMLMQITRTGSNAGALIAENVYHDERIDEANSEITSATWKVEAASKNTNDYSGVIGEMHDGASVNVEFTNNSDAAISANDNVGLFCGKMDSGSSLNVTYSSSITTSSITSSTDNAGGLVGVMEDSASLTVDTIPSGISVFASKGYAGGLVGNMRSTATITNSVSTTISISDTTIEGKLGAGGLYGRLINTGNNTSLDISNYSINVTLDGLYAGGLIGVLENGITGNESATEKYEIKDKNYSTSASTVTSSYKFGTAYTNGYYGGMIGKYVATDLSDELYIHNVKASSHSQSAIYAYGGAIGYIDGVSYVKADNVDITANHSNARTTNAPNYAFFGGIIGATNKNYDTNTNNNSNAVFLDVGNFTLTFNKISNNSDVVDTTNGYMGGGIVGQFYKGVLRLSGNTDLTNAKTYGGYTSNATDALRYSYYGQLVGYNDDVLVYAADDWSFSRYNTSYADDLGTWGEVVRGQEGKAITYYSDDHTVTVAGPETTMSSADDFVKTALNIQLNDNTNYDGVMTFSGGANKKSELLEGNLLLGNDISLVGTGINGLMRDGIATGEFDESNIGDVGVFTGTFYGDGKTITLAIGEEYSKNNSTTEGNGAIYRHRLNGLFAVVGGGDNTTIENVTIAGTENIRNAGPNGITVGGVASRAHGSVKLENITAQQTINYYEKYTTSAPSSEALGKNLGGVVGYVDMTADQTISITGVNKISTNFNFSGNHNSWLCYGALIGKIVSPRFTVNIAQEDDDNLTASYTMNGSEVTSNGSMADGGGLIGYITRNNSSDNRTINIKNTEFKNSKDLNIATTTGGGLLGFAWLDTNVAIDGITTSGAIINSVATVNGSEVATAHVGVLAYMASGKWTVNSLDLTGLTVTVDETASLGMLVNRAYDNGGDNAGKDSNGHGLYIDLLNSGYKLTKTDATTNVTKSATVSVSPAKFDEIAAFTAETPEKVLQGGGRTGIISINMNSSREGNNVKITDTGTYQNQLSSLDNTKYPNNTSRYYYNLDKMSKNAEDKAQDVMLWSVKKYAAGNNLDGYFDSSTSPLNNTTSNTKNVNLTGYSFYPVCKCDAETVANINITFNYSDIYTAENNTTFNTDSYIRDPGNNSTGTSARNQHFLMQSGLFITVSESKSAQFNNVKLSGNFLEIAEYDIGDNKKMSHQGVLVSDTAKGDIKINGLVLDGIVPKMAGDTAYTNGYMLVNKIKRDSTLSHTVALNVNNVSNTDKYTTGGFTAKVAKSLFGTVDGPTINITLSAIKLDSRKTPSAVTDATAKTELDTAFGTVNSIFTQSTLFESIRTTGQASIIYNYTFDEDHGTVDNVRKVLVTYGKEINDTHEYLDDSNPPKSLQLRYFDDTRYTNPLHFDDEDEYNEGEYDFSTNYLPYVKEKYNKNNPDSNGSYFREIAVNVHVSTEITGCGTYNDPYRITKGEDLEKIANFLYNGTIGQNTFNEIFLPKTVYNDLSKNTKGERWCTENDAKYTYQDVNGTYKFKANGVNDAGDWTIDQVRLYLENAYYVIDSNIELSTGFVGLGGSESDTTGTYAFRGVIIGGDKESDGTPKITIKNNSPYPLINISNGCVVKNLNVVQGDVVELKQTATTSNNAAFGYKTPTGSSGCRYYGGVIGEIMGGDNIIDNCYVTQAADAKVKLTGNKGMLCPVGSYVGVVVFGGLIFKNMKTAVANTNARAFTVNYDNDSTNLNLESSKGAIYVNPYVGRVINGYAVNETVTDEDAGTKGRFSVTEDGFYHDGVFDRNGEEVTDEPNTDRAGELHSLKNTKKHYTIADINKNETTKLDVSKIPTGNTAANDGTINIPNSQAFFILSLITQSGAGTATAANGNYSNSLSYGLNGNTVRGMSHIANYDQVGEKNATQPDDYTLYASYDTASDTAVPYIIKHYTTNNNARCVTSSNGYYDINLTKGVSYQLPDSFRGLGCVGKINDNKATCSIGDNPYNMKVDVFDGNGCTIDEDIYLNRFKWDADNYFDTKLNSTKDRSTVSNKEINYDDKDKSLHGIGLFDTVYMRNGTYNTKDPTDFFDKNQDSQIKNFTLKGSVKIETYNLSSDISGSKVASERNQFSKWLACGGVVGYATNNTFVNFNQIKLEKISVYSATLSAGLLGCSALGSTEKWVLINECSAEKISLEVTHLGHHEENKPRDGIGGFVGRVWEGGVKINGGTDGKTVTIKKAYNPSVSKDKLSIAAGLIAYAGNGCTVLNMTIKSADENAPVTLGNECTALSSAVCGLVQPSGSSASSAYFDNVKVENINLKGLITGCFLAGTTGSRSFWGGGAADSQAPRTIYINNCSVVGDKENRNSITASVVAGGFVGDGTVSSAGKAENPNITIHNCLLKNYNITNTSGTSKKDFSVAGFIGYTKCNGDKRIVCSVYDSSIENCQLGDNKAGVYTGAVLGHLHNANNTTSDLIAGYNIKLDNVSAEANASNFGKWIGLINSSNTKSTIQFVGLGIYGCTFPSDKNVASGSIQNESFVYADYANTNNNMSKENENKATYNIDSDVTSPKYPYVNVNPQSSMGRNTGTLAEVISGDGAVLRSEASTNSLYKDYTAKNTMALKLFEDLGNDEIARRYTIFKNTAIITTTDDEGNTVDLTTINDYFKHTTEDDGDRISTYQTERGKLDGVDDFACIVIANTDDDETTNLINRYIQLVTNTTNDYANNSDYFDFDISTCELKGDYFQKVAETDSGLDYDFDNKSSSWIWIMRIH